MKAPRAGIASFRLSFLFILPATLLLTGPLSADTIVFKSGNALEGIVVEEDENGVRLQVDQASTITFSRAEIEKIVYDAEARDALQASWQKAAPPEAVPTEAPSETPSEASSETPPEGAPETSPDESVKTAPDDSPETSAEAPSEQTPSKPPSLFGKGPPLAPTKENQALLSEGEWKVRTSRHFVVYYQDVIQGRAVSDRAEYHLEKILGDLGLPKRRYLGEKFTVFVLKEEDQWRRFLKEVGIQPELTGGFTTGLETKEIYLYSSSIPYLQLAFPHELTHILFEEKAKGRKIPLWFSEGFANYEGGIIGIDEGLMVAAARKGEHIPPSELVTRTRYPADVDQKKIFYTESSKLVEFLITQYGRRRFAQFAERLLEAGAFEEAFLSIYGGKIGSLEELDRLWLQYLLE